MKDTLLNKFNNLYKGCTLYAIHLDGFSHSVFYKDENGERHVDGYSSYAPNQYTASHKCLSADGKIYAFKSFNEEKLLFYSEDTLTFTIKTTQLNTSIKTLRSGDMWYIQNTKTKKYLSFIEMQPVWVDSKENAVTFTMQEISNECIITFNNKLDGLDFVKA